MIDVNVWLARWPFRRLPDDEPAALNVATARAVTVRFDGWVVIAGDAAHAGGA